MEVFKIFSSLIDKPNVPKFYRELASYYDKHEMHHESEAIVFLIENKFGKNNEHTSDIESSGEE